MKSFAALAAVLIVVANAQSGPSCAIPCIEGTKTSCTNPNDTKCHCQDSNYIEGVNRCINGICSGDDIASAESFVQLVCSGAGVHISTSSPITQATSTEPGGSPSSPATAGNGKPSAVPFTTHISPLFEFSFSYRP